MTAAWEARVERFSLLLLQEGEYYFRDYSCVVSAVARTHVHSSPSDRRASPRDAAMRCEATPESRPEAAARPSHLFLD